MSEPTPYTAKEIENFQALDMHPRLLATVDDLRARLADAEAEIEHAWKPELRQAEAERDAARADRVCWRETHNQVAAERDLLRPILRHFIRMAELNVPQSGLPPFQQWEDEDWADSGWTSAEADAIRRALDASPTEGNPE